jgi:hypothetical protein
VLERGNTNSPGTWFSQVQFPSSPLLPDSSFGKGLYSENVELKEKGVVRDQEALTVTA